MKILYHHRTQGRGVEGVHIRGLVGALVELGHEVRVVSVSGVHDGVPPADDEPGGERTQGGFSRALAAVARNVPEAVFELLEMAFNLVTAWRLRRELAGFDADIVYERYALFLYSTVAQARRRGIPVVLEVNDSAVVERVRPLLFRGVATRIEARAFRNCAGLVFVSGAFRDACREAHGDIAPAIVSPNCADVSLFDSSRYDRAAVRRELGLEDALVCGYVGAFVYWHGIAWFVERIIPQMESVPRLSLLLVGDGAVYDEVRSAVERAGLSGRIRLAGRVPHAEVPRYIAAMDYSVLPDSNNYGSPMKVFELMAMGVPVVAPDFGPLEEVISHRRTGWLFPAGDRRACVEAVLEVARAPGALPDIAEAAARYIRAERQWTHNAQAMIALAAGEGRSA